MNGIKQKLNEIAEMIQTFPEGIHHKERYEIYNTLDTLRRKFANEYCNDIRLDGSGSWGDDNGYGKYIPGTLKTEPPFYHAYTEEEKRELQRKRKQVRDELKKKAAAATTAPESDLIEFSSDSFAGRLDKDSVEWLIRNGVISSSDID